MTQLYQITFTRRSTRRTTARRSRRIVAPDLPEAIERLRTKAERAHPGALVTIETAQVYDHGTEAWVRIALHDGG